MYLFLERGGGREKERERDLERLPSICTPTRDGTRSLGMCPDRESNWRPFSWRNAVNVNNTFHLTQ